MLAFKQITHYKNDDLVFMKRTSEVRMKILAINLTNQSVHGS